MSVMAPAYGTIHRVRWFVYTGHVTSAGVPERIPRTASMRGSWPGYDAVCSCGWETQTGGAVRSYIKQEISWHKHQSTNEGSHG